jgi:hypothetical protein
MTADWRQEFGRWDSIALYRRPQTTRSGCALVLIREGKSLGFVRVTTSATRARHEFDVMLGVHSASPETFRIARPLAWGSEGAWGWLATESVPSYPLAAVRNSRDRDPVVREIGAILESSLPRPDDVPPHWVGSHGDLSPWNLRLQRRRVVRVIDWEDAAFAPPGSDAVYAAATAAATFSLPFAVEGVEQEAVDWVRSVVEARRSPVESAHSANNRVLALLDAANR